MTVDMTEYTRKKIKVVYMDPLTLVPYADNARTHDTEIEFLCNSIREHGFDASHAIGVDKDNVIIYGHGRRLAALKLGMTEVPVVVRSDLSPEQVKAYRLADNKVSDLSGWDFDLLDKELSFLKDMDIDMTRFGFEDFEDFETPADVGGDADEDDGALLSVAPETPDSGGSVMFRIVVDCDNARDQKDLCEELLGRGFEARMVV